MKKRPYIVYMRLYIYFIFIYFCGCSSNILSQESYVAHSHLINAENGLVGSQVQSVYEDSRGFIWIGTDYGLNRYDGVKIEHYTQEKSGLASNSIAAIVEDQKGNLWLKSVVQEGALAKIYILDPKTKKAKLLEKYVEDLGGFFSGEVDTLIKNRDGSIWLTTNNGAVYEYQDSKLVYITSFDFAGNQLKNPKNWLKLDKQKLSFSVYNTRKKTEELYLYNYKKQDLTIKHGHSNSSVSILKKQNLSIPFYWLGYNQTVLTFYTIRDYGKVEVIKQIQKEDRTQVFQDQEHHIILFNQRLDYYNQEGDLIKTIIISNELNLDEILLVDQYGGFWFRDSRNKGLHYLRYSQSYFDTYDLDPVGNGNPSVGGMALLGDTTLYIGAMSCENCRINDRIQLELLGSGVRAVWDDQEGRLFYTKEDSVVISDYAGERNQQIYASYTKIGGNFNQSLYLDKQTNKLWVGNNRGLHYLDKTRELIFPVEELKDSALRMSSVHDIEQVGELLWLATSSGLYSWNKTQNKLEYYSTKGDEQDYLPIDIILDIHIDEDNVFWLATKGGGLIKFDSKTGVYKQYNRQDGLASDILYNVYEDDYGNLWMSSDQGIIQFNKEKHWIKNYRKEHGLLDNALNPSSHYQDAKGNLYFGSAEGLVIFHPKDFQQKGKKYPLFITSLSKFDRAREEYYEVSAEFKVAKELILNPSDKGFKLELALLDYRKPELHEYAYKIEGIDAKWTYQKSNIITDKNLAYGTYQLRIKVRNLDGEEVELEQPISLVVLRPFYLRWWFIVLMVVSLFIAVFSFVKWRTRQLLKRQEELEEIVQKRTEKISQQAEDLKKLDKLKSRFLANVTHELKTPLTLILGPTSVLLKKEEKEETSRQLEIIKNNGEQLLGLVDEILDLSKLENNKVILHDNQVILSFFAQRIFTSFEAKANYAKIDYQFIFDAPKHLSLYLDMKKMEKILNNLLSNAIKFSSAKESVLFKVQEQDEFILFEVKDTGQGIHPKDQPHIFQRFYQSEQLHQVAEGGTGIGLAMVAEFVELMNGEIKLESELGKGSTFSVLIPKRGAEYASDFEEESKENTTDENLEPIVIEEKELIEATILLVEDHIEMRDFVGGLLNTNHKIITAGDGVEALVILEEKASEIDLIVSDVMMPRMNGFTLLEKVKAKAEWRAIPIIMLTALSQKEDKLRALTVGVDDYLTKPFLAEELHARVQNLLINAAERKNWIKHLIAQETTEITKSVAKETEEFLEIAEADLKWVAEIESMIQKELDNENFSLSILAKELHVSERHLNRKLKKITGLTPAKFIKEVRLKAARKYLESGKYLTVTEVAFAVGFQTIETFSKSYKSRFGKPPRDYLLN